MNWIEELHTKYHHLFETDDKGEILRGIECADTWKRIVTRLLETLEWYRLNRCHVPNPNFIDRFRHEDGNPEYIRTDPPEIKIFQIKEKFGRFTAYVKCPDRIRAEIDNAIGHAEGQADLTCYSCGKIGEFPKSHTGWIRRVCPECASGDIQEGSE